MPGTGATTTTCTAILERDWPKIGKQLEGKINLYVGDMDNYYLNNAVYLMEEFLEKTKDPVLRGRGQVRRSRRALLERRPDAAQRHLPPPLSPDVRAQDRRAAVEDGPAGGGRDELEVLRIEWAVAVAVGSGETTTKRRDHEQALFSCDHLGANC